MDCSSPVSSMHGIFSARILEWVQFSRSVVSDSLRPHGLQRARPPCPSPTPGVYTNSCPLSRWCHPAISSSVVPFSSCPQCFPESGSFQMSQLFALGAVPFSRGSSQPRNWSPPLTLQQILYCLSHQRSPELHLLWFFWLFVSFWFVF